MITERYNIWEKEEYRYPAAFGFVPNLHTYIHEEKKNHPGILIVPGGAYRFVSPTEGEIVAKRFYDAGFQAFVLTYTTNMSGIAPLKEQPLCDLSRAVRFIRAKKELFHTEEENLFVCGFSAGAHLTGNLAVHWQDAKEENAIYKEQTNKPNGVLLSYPVITSGEFAHRDSFLALCGEMPSEEELRYYSLETQVKKEMPPVFMWQTMTDQSVPAENSLLMAAALKRMGVSLEYHLFPEGIHGLSLSDSTWEAGNWGELYTLEQTGKILDAIRTGRISLPEKTEKQLLASYGYMKPENSGLTFPRPEEGKAVEAVSVWPKLAVKWMRNIG